MVARIFVLSMLTLLAGCTTTGYLDGDYPGEDAGYAVVSLGAAKPVHFASHTLHYRPVHSSGSSQSEEGRFFFAPPWLLSSGRPDIDTADEQAVIIVAALPPGNYEIFATTVFENFGTLQRTFSSNRPFSIPFTVRANEAVYLGAFRALRLTGKNMLAG